MAANRSISHSLRGQPEGGEKVGGEEKKKDGAGGRGLLFG